MSNKESFLVDRFYTWASDCSAKDPAFKYRIESELFFGPLRGGFTAVSDWEMVEVLKYVICFFYRNFAETIVHLVNIFNIWPLVTHLILQQNC